MSQLLVAKIKNMPDDLLSHELSGINQACSAIFLLWWWPWMEM
jgi:hypothetical protein